MKYFEIDFDNEYGICIKGVKQPTIQEAEEFCKIDIEKSNAKHVVFVNETTLEDACNFYDMENEANFPIFKQHTDKINI